MQGIISDISKRFQNTFLQMPLYRGVRSRRNAQAPWLKYFVLDTFFIRF